MLKNITYILLFSLLCNYVQGQICVGDPGVLEWKVWNGLYDDDFSELTALPSYPSRPDTTKDLFKLKGPTNYNDLYGALVEGFIKVDTTTTATFNITANRYGQFYLSTDDNPDNASLLIYNPSQVNQEEHDIFPEQTSAPIVLNAGQYYYFKVVHVEGYGGDHFNIWWKTHLVDANNWNVITAAYLSGIGCEAPPCPEPGTSCDDGNPTTINDMEDGHCNCFGEETTSNTCIGEKSKVMAYRYEGIPGGSLNDLYEATNFPGSPSYSEEYEYFGRRSTNELVDVGHAMQAYLTVPVSGLYKFNVTGDDNTILFLSSDESPDNRQAHQCFVSGWTYMTQHDKYIWQSTSNIFLEKGKYYYIEINQKDGGGSEHFSAFWQTPFTEPGVWKRIPAIYFNDYDCEIACIPQGTLCDDGDPFTNNDMYDANCNCAGTPCTGPDCDSPLANYVPFEKCGLTEQLDDNAENNWLSCQTSANPNPLRGVGHWMEFDLGQRHELYETQIWNYNVTGGTQQGMEVVSLDYSIDGNTWTELGIYNLPLAPGGAGYTGVSGPNFNGIYARYVIITSLDGGGGCRGLGKIAFNAVVCPVQGTICDDGDENTFNDQYDNNCECKGSAFDVNDCGEIMVMLGDTILTTSKYSAIEDVMSLSTIAPSNKVSFVGGKSVILDVGFETDGQSVFLAAIDSCDAQSGNGNLSTREEILIQKRLENKILEQNTLTITQINDNEVMVSYYIKSPGEAQLEIYDMMGDRKYQLINHEFKNKGLYHKRFLLSRFNAGNYQIILRSSEKSVNRLLNVSK